MQATTSERLGNQTTNQRTNSTKKGRKAPGQAESANDSEGRVAQGDGTGRVRERAARTVHFVRGPCNTANAKRSERGGSAHSYSRTGGRTHSGRRGTDPGHTPWMDKNTIDAAVAVANTATIVCAADIAATLPLLKDASGIPPPPPPIRSLPSPTGVIARVPPPPPPTKPLPLPIRQLA